MKEIEPGNISLFTTDDIVEGEEVAYIPKGMHITREIAKQSEYYKILMDKGV